MIEQKINKKINRSALSRLIKYIFNKHKLAVIVIVVCVLLSSVLNMSSSIFLEQIVDQIIMPCIKQGLRFEDFKDKLMQILFTMIAVYSAGIITTIIYGQIMASLSETINNELRKEMFNSMEVLPIKFFDTHAYGDVMSLYTNDIDTLSQFISNSLIQIVSTVFTLTYVVCIMLYYSIWMLFVVLLGALLMLGASKTFAGKSIHYFREQQKETGSTEGYIEEVMNGEKVVKVFTHEDAVKADFNKHNEELFKVSESATFYSNVLGPVLMNISNFVYVIVAIAGSILIFTNCFNISLRGYETSLSVGIVISFLTLTRQFSQSINNISQQIGIIAQASAGAARVFSMIDQKAEQDDGYVTLVNVKIGQDNELIETNERTNIWAWKHPHHEGGVTYTPLKGEIVLNHVDFGYVPEKIVLHDVTIDAKAGERIAFVGATGAGKTTITNLINRFYDIQDGKIRYDGININKIKKSDLRKSLGVVLQDTSLFSGTVLENIRYGRLDATDEEVYEAAKIANAYDFITRLPQGFNTILSSDGANLSQGQRQLLSIARCAVANTPAMILDEATSSIDTRTEQLVQEGTNKLMAGRTVFVIAHRLSTVQSSNDIIVLDHGKIIEEGNHKELIDKKGVYYQLYTGAFELE